MSSTVNKLNLDMTKKYKVLQNLFDTKKSVFKKFSWNWQFVKADKEIVYIELKDVFNFLSIAKSNIHSGVKAEDVLQELINIIEREINEINK